VYCAFGLPPQPPKLAIDPGMHMANIPRIASMQRARCCRRVPRQDGAVVASAAGINRKRCSRSPGAPAQGKLLNILRPPIGLGNDGKVYAVAVAPDGSWQWSLRSARAIRQGERRFENVNDGATQM